MATALGALLIFVMRVGDVSVGTFRILMLMRGRRALAGVLAFVESLLWVVAAGQVITNLDSPLRVTAFAAGFAVGTVVGSTVERWIAIGKAVMRVIYPIDSSPVAPALRDEGFGVTVVNAQGLNGEVQLAFTVIPRRERERVLTLVSAINPDAFVTIEDVETPNLRRASRVRK